MKRLLAMLAAAMLPFAAFSASYTNSFIRNGVTYVQRGGLTIKDYVITNIDENAIGSSMTTNDVCNIVTNEVVGYTKWEWQNEAGEELGYELPVWNSASNRWTFVNIVQEDVYEPGASDPNAVELITSFGTLKRSETTQNALGLARLIDLPPLTNNLHVASMTTNEVCDIVTNGVNVYAYSEWTITSSSQYPIYLIFYDNQWRPVDIEGNPDALVGDPQGDINSTNLIWTAGDDGNASYDITATRTITSSYKINSLGLAGETGAVNEILMIGSDNKLYHLRIGSGGSIDVYTETE